MNKMPFNQHESTKPISRTRQLLALTLAIISIGVDFLLIHDKSQYFHLYRIMFSVLAVFCLIWFACDGKYKLTGLIIRPNKGLRYWIKGTMIFVICDLVIIVLVFLISLKLDVKFSGMSPISLLRAIPEFCICHAIEEELLYRFVLCTSFLWLLGHRWAIIVSSIVFSILHAVYGAGIFTIIISFLYGCIFAWAYIESGSILTTIVWHSFANLIAIGSSLVQWYLIN